LHDLEHILETERLEVELVRNVEVGRDGLRIRVDHDRLVAGLAKREHRAHAAVVELDALPNAIRPAAEDHDRRFSGARRLALLIVASIEIRRGGWELAGTRVDHLVHGAHAQRPPMLPRCLLALAAQRAELRVGEAHPLHAAHLERVDLAECAIAPLRIEQVVHLIEKPAIDLRELVDLLDRKSALERVLHLEDALGRRLAQRAAQRLERVVLEAIVGQSRADVPSRAPDLQRAQPLLKRFLEGAPDRHRLAHGLHLRGEPRIGRRELLEGEARALHHDVVEHRLERGGSRLRDVVRDLVEAVAHCELGPDARDRKARRLRCERGRPRDARIHLDHEQLAIGGIHRELDVAAARFDADLADDRDRGIAHLLVLAVGERERGRDGDRVARVHAHWIDVLDRAHDHHVVGVIAHDFELVLLPAKQAALDEHLARGRQVEPAAHDVLVLLAIVRDAASGAAERERRANDRGEAHHGNERDRVIPGTRDAAGRDALPDAPHRIREELAILGEPNGACIGADQLHAVSLEHAAVRERERDVERRLSPHRGQQRIRPLALDHLLHHVRRHRLHVRPIGELGIRHDRGRIRVHEHDRVALFAQRLRRLRARVIELGPLADHDRARAYEQDLLYVSATRHG
jgi:hypothetical protein